MSEDERGIADELRVTADRNRFLVRRALRRSVLAHRLETAPALIRYEAGPDGKPSVSGGGIEFSASHADDDTVLAVCDFAGVGIDIEPSFEAGWDETVEDLLGAKEYRSLRALPPKHRARAYFATWTRKEAALKALGSSIVERDPRQVEVTVPPAPPRLLALDGDEVPGDLWLVQLGFERNSLVGSLAVLGSKAAAVLRSWPLDGGPSPS